MNAPIRELSLLQSSAIHHVDSRWVCNDLTAADSIFTSEPNLERLPEFMFKLEALRASLPFEAWRELCHVERRPWNAWIEFFLVDPFTHHGLTKPRGYPGDASLMDFAYGHPSVRQRVDAASPTGQAIYEVLRDAGMCVSARVRTDLVAELLGTAIAAQGPITVVSFAAGHARELEKLADADAAQILQFTSVDTDAISQAEVEASQAGRIPVRSIRRNAVRVRAAEIGTAAFVYSMGLFDYLERPYAERVVRSMAETVSPGGQLLIGNLAQNPANIAYCEAITDWWMVLRSEAEMVALGATLIDLSSDWSAEVLRRGCFYYILARRAG
jgi:hypothetical protein